MPPNNTGGENVCLACTMPCLVVNLYKAAGAEVEEELLLKGVLEVAKGWRNDHNGPSAQHNTTRTSHATQ